MSTFSKRRAASAKLSKRVAAAAASVVLIGSSVPATVLSAVAPQVAMASVVKADPIAGVTLATNDGEITSVALSFTNSAKNSGKAATATVTIASGSVAYSGDGITDASSFVACGFDASDLSSVAVTAASGFTATSVANGENVVEKNSLSTSADIANLGIDGKTVELTIGSDINVIAGAVAVYTDAALSSSASSGTQHTLKYTDADGKAVDSETVLTLSKFGSYEVAPEPGYHFFGWGTKSGATDLAAILSADEQADPVLDKEEIEKILATKTSASNRADLVASSKLSARVAAITTTLSFDLGEGGKFTSKTETNTAAWSITTPADVTKQVTALDEDVPFVGWALEDGTLVSNATGEVDKDVAATVKAIAEAASDADNGGEATVALHAVYGKALASKPSQALTFTAYDGDPDDTYSTSAKGGTVQVSGSKAAVTDNTSIATAATGTTDLSLRPVTAVADDGYSFVGWYALNRAANALTLITEESVLSVDDIEANVLYDTSDLKSAVSTSYVAVFHEDGKGDTYTLTFDVNGATPVDGVKDFSAFAARKLEVGVATAAFPGVAAQATLAGAYEMAGYVTATNIWNTEPDGSGTNVTNTNVEKIAAGKDITLYAQWTKDSTRATVETKAADGVTVKLLNEKGEEVDSIVGTAVNNPVFSKFSISAEIEEGYTFDGWDLVDLTNGGTSTTIAVKALNSVGGLSDTAYTGLDITKVLADANIGTTAQNHTYTFAAKAHANKYTAIFDGEQVALTVGEDAEIPEGEWVTKDGTKVSSKADLDKLATTDGAVIQLSKAKPETPVSPTTPTSPTSPTTPTTPVGPTYKEGWNDVTGSGDWIWVENGEPVTNRWIEDGGNWYYLDNSGAMATGWLNDGFENGVAVWYYMSTGNYGPKGSMTKGWIFDGAWYYMNEGGYATYTGQMVRSKAVPGGTVGADGKWVA